MLSKTIEEFVEDINRPVEPIEKIVDHNPRPSSPTEQCIKEEFPKFWTERKALYSDFLSEEWHPDQELNLKFLESLFLNRKIESIDTCELEQLVDPSVEPMVDTKNEQ